MAVLTLRHTWINLVATGEAVAAPTTGRSQSWDTDGDWRSYAGGRQRFIGTEGERGRFAVTLRLLTLAQVTTLRGWKAQLVQFRDHRGQRIYGVFRAVTPVEHKHPGLYDVAVEIGVITHTEGV
jgi:hypothetical protein